VAHEICHSWSGNLVTNSTWQDFWMNEGFTMYLERCLLSAVIGGEEYRKFHLILGYQELKRVAQDFLKAGEVEFTKLRPYLLGTDPDDAFSIIPYEKGCLFLLYLEILVGGKDVFLGWLNSFYLANLRGCVTSQKMQDHFLHYFSNNNKVDPEKLKSIDWNTWLNGPGLPSFDPSSYLVNSYSESSEKVIKKWADSKDGSDLNPADINTFKPSQLMFCLDAISVSHVPMNHKVLEKMEEIYKFTSKNVEISNRFIGVGLKSKYAAVVPACEKLLAEHGRGRYVKYLYNCLNDYDHNLAVKNFQANKHLYHSVIVNAFQEKLGK